MGNLTSVTEFILLGLTDNVMLQAVLFLFLLLTYFLSIMGNLTIIILTLLDHHLQTPMYFFLQNFAILEISFTSVFVPQTLVNIGTGDKTVSFAGCFTQYFFAILLGATKFYLLAAMSYDHYVAICRPLHYTAVMSKRLCIQLVLSSWLSGFVIVIVSHIYQLPFCASNDSLCACCGDPNLYLVSVDSFLHLHYQDHSESPFHSTEKKTLFYMFLSHDCGLAFLWKLYLHVYKSFCKDTENFNKRMALLNTSIAPVLNPVIYILRNKQVKIAFKHMVSKMATFFKK
uniref:G-protein coupled receptors family 1 profile domain-containing protein n=1 Tax=Castor canadensis TaxID=51338 RepID=A0A8C0W632_CASCN